MPHDGVFDGVDRYGHEYERDGWPHRRQHPYSAYVVLPPLLEIPRDTLEASAYLSQAYPNYQESSLMMAEPQVIPFSIYDEFDICRAWVDKHETMTDVGHIFWAEFNSIDPCWFLLDSEEAHKLLSEEECGRERPAAAHRRRTP